MAISKTEQNREAQEGPLAPLKEAAGAKCGRVACVQRIAAPAKHSLPDPSLVSFAQRLFHRLLTLGERRTVGKVIAPKIVVVCSRAFVKDGSFPGPPRP
jgi:hypothetical protein